MRKTIIASMCLLAGSALAGDPAPEFDESYLWDIEGWNTSPVIGRLCAGPSSWERCAAAAESAFLLTHPEVERHRARLFLTLGNGRSAVFDDCTGLGGYTYLGTIEPLRYHLVVYSYEETDYYLVNKDTGWQVRVDAFPVVSPGGAWVATARPDLERGDLPNRVQVWAAEGDTLRLDYVLDGRTAAHLDRSVSEWGPLHPRWLDTSTLVFDTLARSGVQGQKGISPGPPLALRRTGDTWSVSTRAVPEIGTSK